MRRRGREGGACFSPGSETAAGLADASSSPPTPNTQWRAGGRDRRLLLQPLCREGRSPLLHTHTDTRSVSPPSRSGPFLPAPLPSSLPVPAPFFSSSSSFSSPPPPPPACPPSPRPDPLRRAGELRLLLLKLLRRSQRFPLFRGETEGGGAAAIRSRSPYKSVCVCVGGGGTAPDTPLPRRVHGHSCSYNGGRASLPLYLLLSSLPLPAVKRGRGLLSALGPPQVPSRRSVPGEGAQRPGEAAGAPPPSRGSRGWVVVVASFSSSDRNGVSGGECRGSRGVWEPGGETAAEAREKGGSGKGKGEFREEPSAPTRSLAPLPPPGASGWCGALALCFKFQVQPRPLSHDRGFYRSLSSS